MARVQKVQRVRPAFGRLVQRVAVAADAADYKKAGPRPPVISTEAGQPPIGKPLIVQARGQLRLTWRLYAESPQSGEISSSDGTGGITVRDLSTQSIINAFSICPIPTRSPARDDDVGGQHWTHLRCEGSKGSKDSEGSEGCIERFLRWTGLTAGGFLGLTGLWPEGGGGALRAQIIKKGAPQAATPPKARPLFISYFPKI